MDERSIKTGFGYNAARRKFVPIVVPGLSTSFYTSSRHSTSRHSQDKRNLVLHLPQARPSPTTSSSDNETREREDRTKSDASPVTMSISNVDGRTAPPVVDQANPKLPKTKESKIERSNPLSADSGRASSEIPEWLQEFREKLVDDEVLERRDSHASSSHEVSLEPIFKRRENLGKNSVYTHFPKRPKLRDLSEDQNYKGPVQETQWRSRSSCKNFW